MLFMIDTCQANTMYSKFYSPNILATGSSEIDQSSYSHHADSDVGVAVIDRYTYYNLEFLEKNVRDPTSKVTLGELFDSYNPADMHSDPGIRYDLFAGGEAGARSRLIMDFFGNVQNVEVDSENQKSEEQWQEELQAIDDMILEAKRRYNESLHLRPQAQHIMDEVVATESQAEKISSKPGAVKIDTDSSWYKQIVGAAALLGFAGVWAAGSYLESL